MKKDIIFECGTCHKEKSQRNIKRIGQEIICKECHKERKKNHREFLKRNILGIRKREDLVKEWESKRKERKLEVPKIKGAKKRAKNSRNPYIGIYLTKIEKYIIYKKHAHLGVEFAKRRVKEITEQFNKMIEMAKLEGKEDEEINRMFKEEFAKLIMGKE